MVSNRTSSLHSLGWLQYPHSCTSIFFLVCPGTLNTLNYSASERWLPGHSEVTWMCLGHGSQHNFQWDRCSDSGHLRRLTQLLASMEKAQERIPSMLCEEEKWKACRVKWSRWSAVTLKNRHTSFPPQSSTTPLYSSTKHWNTKPWSVPDPYDVALKAYPEKKAIRSCRKWDAPGVQTKPSFQKACRVWRVNRYVKYCWMESYFKFSLWDLEISKENRNSWICQCQSLSKQYKLYEPSKWFKNH